MTCERGLSIIRNAFIFLTAANRLPWPSEGSSGTLCVFYCLSLARVVLIFAFVSCPEAVLACPERDPCKNSATGDRGRAGDLREVTHRLVSAKPSATLVTPITEFQAAREELPASSFRGAVPGRRGSSCADMCVQRISLRE